MRAATNCPWTAKLVREGYCIIPAVVGAATIAKLAAELDPVFAAKPFSAGRFIGCRTKRCDSLLWCSRHALTIVTHPAILAMARSVLSSACDEIQLNGAQATEMHPGEVQQFPHRAEDVWQGAKGEHEYLISVMWPLTPFTADNGAIRIYPFSHAAEGVGKAISGKPIVAECGPGSAICLLGSTAHGYGANLTDDICRAIVIGYCLGWLRPEADPKAAHPIEVARHFSSALAALAGVGELGSKIANGEDQSPLADTSAAFSGGDGSLLPPNGGLGG